MVVERLQAFVNSLARTPDDLDAASARLEEILHAPRAYRPWVASVSLAMMGAAISALLGADWVTWILTFFSALFIDQTLSRLGRWGLPPFFGQVVAAMIPTSIAVAIYAIEKYQPTLGGIPLDPPGDQYHSLIVAAGIIVLLAGLAWTLQPGHDAAAMLALGVEGVKSYIKTIGLFNSKAENVIKTCRILLEQHNGEVPEDRAALEALPGVGRKTANVVLNTAFGWPTIAVDTHIFRVCNRTQFAPGKNVEQVEEKLLKVVPAEFKVDCHHWLILHGRYTCIARKPRCGSCLIEDLCEYKEKVDL